MKKFIFVLILFTASAFAQTEQGNIRIGGSSRLGFSNVSFKQPIDSGLSINFLSVNIHGGYFFVSNLSFDAGLGLEYSSYSSKDFSGRSTQVGGDLGFRYYLPTKFFLGSNFDIIYIFTNSFYYPVYGLNFVVGYAWFLSEKIAFEPSMNYRLGFIDDKRDNNSLYGQVGISIHF